MSVKSGQAVTVDFTTADPTTGAAANASSLPTAKLVVNGTDNAAAVTVTNKATGVYKAAVTLPTLAAGDVVSIRVAATVATVAGVGVVWTDVADTVRLSDGVTLAATQAAYAPAKAGDAMTLTAAYDAAKAAASQASVNAIPTTPLLAAGYTAPDNASVAAILEDTGTTLPATLAGIATNAASAAGADFGEDECTLTITDTLGAALSDAQVYVYVGAARSRVKTTDSLGQVKFDLTDGETYNLWVTHDRYTGTNPTSFVASKDV